MYNVIIIMIVKLILFSLVLTYSIYSVIEDRRFCGKFDKSLMFYILLIIMILMLFLIAV